MAQNPSLKNAAMAAGLEQVLHYLEKDPETNIPKIMKLIDTVTPRTGMSSSGRDSARPSRRRTTGTSSS